MQFQTIALSFFAAAAAAQNSTQSLPDLVSQLPTCAIDCFESGAEAAGCATTDFACLCGTGKSSFISSAGICILSSSCDSDEQSKVVTLATDICNDVSQNPSPSELASASSMVSSALSEASATQTPDAAVRPEIGAYGVLGVAAAAAAFAL